VGSVAVMLSMYLIRIYLGESWDQKRRDRGKVNLGRETRAGSGLDPRKEV